MYSSSPGPSYLVLAQSAGLECALLHKRAPAVVQLARQRDGQQSALPSIEPRRPPSGYSQASTLRELDGIVLQEMTREKLVVQLARRPRV
eukprot:scaffold5798_cov105-Isochrysis_galbana.AAC.2